MITTWNKRCYSLRTKFHTVVSCKFMGPTCCKFMGPIWGSPGSCRPQMGPMLASLTLLSGKITSHKPCYAVHYSMPLGERVRVDVCEHTGKPHRIRHTHANGLLCGLPSLVDGSYFADNRWLVVCRVAYEQAWWICIIVLSLIHGANMGPIRDRKDPGWAPCWPHELCYLGSSCQKYLALLQPEMTYRNQICKWYVLMVYMTYIYQSYYCRWKWHRVWWLISLYYCHWIIVIN